MTPWTAHAAASGPCPESASGRIPAAAVIALLYAGVGGLLFFLPFNLMQAQGYSANEARAARPPHALKMFLRGCGEGGGDRRGDKLFAP